jgi:hypothetical protein
MSEESKGEGLAVAHNYKWFDLLTIKISIGIFTNYWLIIDNKKWW